MKERNKRITQLTYENDLSHYGSSQGVYEVLKVVERIKKSNDIIVLDEAHGALGYYVWLEEQDKANAQHLIDKHGVHQSRDKEHEIEVSGGSLGLAGAIALGIAMANKERNVFCITSDGALAEGIWWETLRLKADKNVDNLVVLVNLNLYSAYDTIDEYELIKRVHTFCPDVIFVRTYVEGLQDHYRKITKEEYERTK